MSDNTIATYLRENPRLMGVLFTMCLLLSQAGSVAANHADAISGP
jgi:hypothetical protein